MDSARSARMRDVHSKITYVLKELQQMNPARTDLNQWRHIESAINAGEKQLALEGLFYLIHFEALETSGPVLRTMASLVDGLYLVPPPAIKAWAVGILTAPEVA